MLRLLYVEDDLRFCSTVAAFLRGRGHVVETAGEGVAGLSAVTKALATGLPFDLVITDLRMPGMDGVSFIRALRQARQSLGIIVYSCELVPENIVELAALAVDAIIPKGTRPEFLAETVIKVGCPS